MTARGRCRHTNTSTIMLLGFHFREAGMPPSVMFTFVPDGHLKKKKKNEHYIFYLRTIKKNILGVHNV